MGWAVMLQLGLKRRRPVSREKSLIASDPFVFGTFSSVLKANGEDVKIVQELLRHSTARMTLDKYTQAVSPHKRATQSKVVSMIRPKGLIPSLYRGLL